MKQYYKTANEIQARQNGLVDDAPQRPAAQTPPPPPVQAPDSMQMPPLNYPQK